MFKGWKFVVLGLAVALVEPLLNHLDGLKADLMNCAVTKTMEICAWPEWVAPALGITIILLRALTTTAIFNKTTPNKE